MVQAAGPDPHAAVRLVVLVPALAVLCSHAALLMPRVHVQVQLCGTVEPGMHVSNRVLLHFGAALEDVLNLNFVGRQRTPLSPITARAVDDEVVEKAWHRHRRIHVG